MLKNFHFTEQVYLQFRAEYFNLFNVTNLSNPNTSVDLPAVGGKIFSTSTRREDWATCAEAVLLARYLTR